MKKFLGSGLGSIVVGGLVLLVGLLQTAQEGAERDAENAELVEKTAQRTVQLLKGEANEVAENKA